MPNDKENLIGDVADKEDLTDMPMNPRRRPGMPNQNQLDQINSMSLVTLTEEDVFVFRPLMIDNQVTSHNSMVHENLLTKFITDANKGVGLLLNHNSRSLPVGRTYSSELSSGIDGNGTILKSLFGDVYIDLGRQTESGMSTNDIARGIMSGTIFDVSIGFTSQKGTCSICGNDIRDYMNCPHIPGKDYSVESENGVSSIQKCVVIMGDDGKGQLLELSLVYAGACDRATIKNNFSTGVTNDAKETKLTVVDDIKKVPLNAVLYQQYSRSGYSLYTLADTTLDNNEKRSEPKVNILEIINSKLNLSIESDEQLESKLQEYITGNEVELGVKNESIETLTTELESAKAELANATVELETSLASKEVIIAELTSKNEELTALAGVAETYRQELVTSTIESGVRAQGNAFQAELFTKFLDTLSIEEVKLAKAGFESEFNSRFTNASTTETFKAKTKDNEPKSKEDFESDRDFTDFIGEEAIKLAKENSVTIKEATQQLINKFSIKRSE